MIQNNLGIVYTRLPTGDRSENLAKAIAYYEAALHVRKEHDFPVQWAATQNNLGSAYFDLPTGDRNENLAKAIAYYETALRVRTERDFPNDWADTQYNLGLAYQEFGNRDQAILCYESAARGYAAVGFTNEAQKARQRAAALS
jgi:tetratricopeptide (TPR) repeat protein